MVVRDSTPRRAIPHALALCALTLSCETAQEGQTPPAAVTAASQPPAPAPAATADPDITPLPDPDADNRLVRSQLRQKTINRIEFTADTGDYLEVIRLVRTVTDIPIILTPEARTVIADENLVLEIVIVAPISIDNLLDLMASRSDSLAWTVRNGVVEFGTKSTTGADNVLVTHDIRDLVFARTEFVPPVIRGIPTGEESEPLSGSEGDEKVSYIEPDALQDVIRMSTDSEYWEAEGGGTMEYVDSGYLLVHATPVMQRRVAHLLEGMR